MISIDSASVHSIAVHTQATNSLFSAKPESMYFWFGKGLTLNSSPYVVRHASMLMFMTRECVRNFILGYPTLIHKIFGTYFGEIHRVNLEILGYPRISRIPL